MANAVRTIALGVLVSMAALAQSTASSVSGTVVDSSGAQVPGATCQLTNQATGAVATAVTMEAEALLFPRFWLAHTPSKWLLPASRLSR